MRVPLKGIATATATLADGESVTYCYAWRGGPRLRGKPGSPEFLKSYNDAVKLRKTAPDGTLFSLIAEFKASAEFISTRPATRRDYLRYQSLIEREFGDVPLEALSDPEVRGVFKEWRDRLSVKPRTAD